MTTDILKEKKITNESYRNNKVFQALKSENKVNKKTKIQTTNIVNSKEQSAKSILYNNQSRNLAYKCDKGKNCSSSLLIKSDNPQIKQEYPLINTTRNKKFDKSIALLKLLNKGHYSYEKNYFIHNAKLKDKNFNKQSLSNRSGTDSKKILNSSFKDFKKGMLTPIAKSNFKLPIYFRNA